MEAGSLLHLPRSLKRAISFTLILGFIFSSILLISTLIQGSSDSPLLQSAVSLFQFLASGAALAIIAFYSKKNIGTDELLAQTTQFLVKEMPRAFKSNLIVRPLREQDWSITETVSSFSTAIVKIDHVQGTASATYSVQAFGTKIKLRVTLNAFKFVVLYYIPRLKHSELEIERVIDLVISGARTVEYTHRVTLNPSLDDNIPLIEVYFFRTTERDLLLDSSSRLFWSQDIAIMTKSMLLQLKRGEVSLDYDSQKPAV